MARNPLQQQLAADSQLMSPERQDEIIDSIFDNSYSSTVESDPGRPVVREEETEEVVEEEEITTEDHSEDGDTDEVGEDGDDNDGTEEVEDDKADEDQEEGSDIESFTELAEVLETDVSALQDLKVQIKVNGEESEATLSEVIAGYQRSTDYDRSKTALAEERRAFETEKAGSIDELNKQASVAGQIMTLVEQGFQQQLQSPDLAKLRTDDPAEWVAKTQELGRQLQGVQEARNAAAQQYDSFLETSRTEYLQAEAKKLTEVVPGWGEDKLRVAVDTVKSLGFTDDEVVQMSESRIIVGALELSNLRTENAALKARIEKGTKAAKTIKRTIPKAIKPGAKKTSSKRTLSRNRLQEAQKRLKRSGSNADSLDALEAMGL